MYPKEQTMTWLNRTSRAVPRRGETLRDVIATANDRCDGRLPLDVPGVAETFHDELDLLGALQLRWHSRLTGHLEQELVREPIDLDQAVEAAWRTTVRELPGVRAIIDRHRAEPGDAAIAEAMAKSAAKERDLLALASGQPRAA
jgi:hypothetical protein